MPRKSCLTRLFHIPDLVFLSYMESHDVASTIHLSLASGEASAPTQFYFRDGSMVPPLAFPIKRYAWEVTAADDGVTRLYSELNEAESNQGRVMQIDRGLNPVGPRLISVLKPDLR